MSERPGGAGGESFEWVGGETVYDGRLIEVRIEHYRHADGSEATREVVRHGGAVAIVAYDESHVWLVRQPREAVGEPALLELPAGRLDVEGEPPPDAARRELAEEIGRGAERWEPIMSYYAAAGISNEEVHLFAATELHEASADSGEEERIDIVQWPLGRLEDAIAECRDAKTLIGLFWLARRLNA